jgi:hypothetical protein
MSPVTIGDDGELTEAGRVGDVEQPRSSLEGELSPVVRAPRVRSEAGVSTTDADVRVMKMADGGFTKLQALDELCERGTQPVLAPPSSRNAGINPLAPRSTVTPAQAQWRELMASDRGKALYVWRAATVDCANAQLRRRRLTRFNVCDLAKAQAVLQWHALAAHNLMRLRTEHRHLGLYPGP